MSGSTGICSLKSRNERWSCLTLTIIIITGVALPRITKVKSRSRLELSTHISFTFPETSVRERTRNRNRDREGEDTGTCTVKGKGSKLKGSQQIFALVQVLRDSFTLGRSADVSGPGHDPYSSVYQNRVVTGHSRVYSTDRVGPTSLPRVPGRHVRVPSHHEARPVGPSLVCQGQGLVDSG